MLAMQVLSPSQFKMTAAGASWSSCAAWSWPALQRPAFEITQMIFFLGKMEKKNKASTMEYALHGPTLLPFRRHLQQPLYQ
jgi:hypothetical protein